MSDTRKRSKIWNHFNFLDNTKAECRVCKKRISYRAGSTNNLHRYLRTVHPSVQWEDKTQSVECDINEGANPLPEKCRPTALVGDRGFNLSTSYSGDDTETVHCGNISPL